MAEPYWSAREKFMKRRWFWSCYVAAVLLATAFISAQQPSTNSSNTLAFENGTILNSVYSNECFGFSLPIPAGWEINDTVTPGGKARYGSSDKDLILLFLERKDKTPGRIILSAWNSASHPGNAQDFVSAEHAQIDQSTEKTEPVQDAFAVDYGGRHFFRSNQKSFVAGNVSWYPAKIYTEFRGYFIGANLVSTSPAGLNEAADSLQKISFREDQVNPKCVVSWNTAAAPAGTKNATPERVRVSSEVSTGLLIKKVQPQYPAGAKQARVEGTVVMKAEIDKKGHVEELSLISGDPLLAPAALKAVKKWKYKPYVLNGQPVKVETQVVVKFTLSSS
jgi:TonB family protein